MTKALHWNRCVWTFIGNSCNVIKTTFYVARQHFWQSSNDSFCRGNPTVSASTEFRVILQKLSAVTWRLTKNCWPLLQIVLNIVIANETGKLKIKCSISTYIEETRFLVFIVPCHPLLGLFPVRGCAGKFRSPIFDVAGEMTHHLTAASRGWPGALEKIDSCGWRHG